MDPLAGGSRGKDSPLLVYPIHLTTTGSKESYERVEFEERNDFFIHREQFMRYFFTTTLGEIVLVVIIGHISITIYEYFANQYSPKRNKGEVL
jgi:hypothetical protein